MNLNTEHGPPVTSKIGALFDWDGVIIDSHDQHEQSWFLLAEEIGKPMTRDLFKTSFGMRNAQIIPELFHWANPDDQESIQRLGDRKEALYREIIRRDGIEPLPGVADLLHSLKESRIPCAVGSSTPLENIDCLMDMLGFKKFFQAVVSAEDVDRGKPDPQVFLLAASRIQRAPENCVVFEDAHAGVEAGKRGGMKTIAVTTTHPAGTLDDADLVVDSLAEVTLDAIASLLR